MFSKLKSLLKRENKDDISVLSIDEYYDEYSIPTVEKIDGKEIRKITKVIKTKEIIINNAFKAIEENDQFALRKALRMPLKGIEEIEPHLILAALNTNKSRLLISVLNAIDGIDVNGTKTGKKITDLFLLIGVKGKVNMFDTFISWTRMQPAILSSKISEIFSDLVRNNREDVIEQLYKKHHIRFCMFEIEYIKDQIERTRQGIISSVETNTNITQIEKEIQLNKSLLDNGLNIDYIVGLINEYQNQPVKNTNGRPSAIELRKLYTTMPDYLKVKLT